jgi:hypothetical protein
MASLGGLLACFSGGGHSRGAGTSGPGIIGKLKRRSRDSSKILPCRRFCKEAKTIAYEIIEYCTVKLTRVHVHVRNMREKKRERKRERQREKG